MNIKPVKTRDKVLITYTKKHWDLLDKFRRRALTIMEALHPQVRLLLVGSVARGDVHEGSDVDLAMLEPYPPGLLEELLTSKGFHICSREVVQATPLSTPKLYLHIPGNVKVSIPLSRLSPLEEEFYRFAGCLTLNGLKEARRVAGVNKRLLLILPTSEGHVEFSIIGREAEAARILNVSIRIVGERVEKLLTRDRRGRRGLYIRALIPPWEGTEEFIKKLQRKHPSLRNIL